MNTKLQDIVGNDNINDFLKKIIESIKFVDKRISKFSSFKLNSRSEPTPLHSEMQICAIIASVFFLKYASILIDEEGKLESFSLHLDCLNPNWKTKYEALLKENLSKKYIMEILQGRWSGSGNTKLDLIISNNDYYAQVISSESFLNVFESWFNAMNMERQERKQVPKPKEPELLMLSTIYLMSDFPADSQLNGSKFDIEHLAPKQKMKDRLEKYSPEVKLPISSFGNLCLLPEYENRSKGKKTLYEDTEYLSKSKLSLNEIENNYSFTQKTDLDWILDDTLSENEFKKAYFDFLTNRFNRLKQILIDNYSKI